MNTMIIILSLLCGSFIEGNIIYNKMEKIKITKSLPIFIKGNLDRNLSANKHNITTIKDFLKYKIFKTFDSKSILPPLN